MRRRFAVLPAALLGLLAGPALGQSLPQFSALAAPAAPAVAADAEGGARLHGRSGKLRAAVVRSLEPLDLPVLAAFGGEEQEGGRFQWVPLFGAGSAGLLGAPVIGAVPSAPAAPGIWGMGAAPDAAPAAGRLSLITQVPFDRKRNGYLNGYHIGRYPAEGSGRSDRYAPPAGFIEVTRENQDFQISEHFRLRHFLTKDQHDVWPKYLALDLRLIDKLELVLQELNAMGVRADRMHVMSGFRTPQYNGPGGDGRATLSRHTYGDAADVWVDSDGDGYMDDLNGDGRADIHDARVMLRAVERVEERYPELVGGAGLYVANRAHGPFIHIDVRGNAARW